MRERFSTWAVASVLAAALGACGSFHPTAPAPPEPPADSATSLDATERQLARRLYVAKCARCHKFYDPARYSEKDWHGWMDKMSRKAKLKPEQKELLLRYLDLYRVGSKIKSGSS